MNTIEVRTIEEFKTAMSSAGDGDEIILARCPSGRICVDSGDEIIDDPNTYEFGPGLGGAMINVPTRLMTVDGQSCYVIRREDVKVICGGFLFCKGEVKESLA